ncbi:MAG TPA: hypothetical protein PLC81_01275 [Bacteroidales bacterium]|nr:hypothetical protein [Bacteroidales bacterium]HQK36242.1 hypothetical protein [Bacteroidales bacterium]
MQRFLIILILLPGSLFLASGQYFVGLPKDSVMVHVRKEMRFFLPDNSGKNDMYRYLKFVDKINEETLYCFLSEKDICTSTRLISDYSNLQKRLEWLGKNCKKQNDSTWYYIRDGRKYQTVLRKEEWFFVLITKSSED